MCPFCAAGVYHPVCRKRSRQSSIRQNRRVPDRGIAMKGRDALEALSDILGDVPDLVFAYTRDERYLFVNTAAARFLGAELLEVIAYHWRELGRSAAVMEPLTDRIKAVASSGVPEHCRVIGSPERGSRVFDMSLTPMQSPEGNVLAVLAIAHDITEILNT